MMSGRVSFSSYGATNSDQAEHDEEDFLRRKLKYFFLNPCEKWRAKKKFPWKLLLQIIKIIVVTVQLTMFGVSRSAHVEFLEKSNIAFKHLFLQHWTSALETLPYPPASGAFAVYTHDAFYASVNYAMKQYEDTEQIAVGTYQFTRPNDSTIIPSMELCNSHYRLSQNWARNQTYQFDARQETDCLPINHFWEFNNNTKEFEKVYDVKRYLEQHSNHSINFDGVNKITLKFKLTAIHFKYLSRLNTPDCYVFNIEVEYDNSEHNGQMLVKLRSWGHQRKCFGEIHYDGGSGSVVVFSTVFDGVVIMVSLLSFLLCLRSLLKGFRIQTVTVAFFESHYQKKLTLPNRLEFLNMWYVLIIINDVLTIIGSAYKIGIENKFSHNYEACGILLGTGSLLVWFGVLRYLGFFHKYNILILTMKKSAPNILRFLVCAGVFYFGFTVCGWVVLGPYHIKFRTISSSSECLFSLVNGDDMFVTFATIGPNSAQYIWVFSRIYLYVFISLFIYMVLNIFLTVIMDAYDTLKNYNEHGFPKGPVEEFIDQCTDEAHLLFRSYSTDHLREKAELSPPCDLCLCGCLPTSCCSHRSDSEFETSGEHSSLIST